MKLYMIWYLAGEIVLSAGPLPYGLFECESRAAEMTGWVSESPNRDLHHLDIKCEMHEKRPELRDHPSHD